MPASTRLPPVAMIMPFLMIRFVAEAFIVSPNNLATLQALPENKVYMATGLSGLLRSIANTMGTALAAVVWDQRYNYRLQQYAEETPWIPSDTREHSVACNRCSAWSGEVVAQIPTQTMALIQDRLAGRSQYGRLARLFYVQRLPGSAVPVSRLALLAPGEVSGSDHAPAGRDSSRGTRTKHAVAVRLSGCFCQIDILVKQFCQTLSFFSLPGEHLPAVSLLYLRNTAGCHCYYAPSGMTLALYHV